MAFGPEAEARDQLDLDLDCLRECTYVEEAAEIGFLIQQTVETHGAAAQTAYPRFRKIVSSPSTADSLTRLLCTHKAISVYTLLQLEKYQEQSQLLDPHLESIITPLSRLLMQSAVQPSADSILVVQHVSKMLWSIASVR